MKKIKLTKINELPNAEVPNNIPEGEYRIGIMEELPKVGKSFVLTFVSNKNGYRTSISNFFVTSVITEIVSPFIFKTLNSIYQIEYLKDDLSINDLTD